MSRDTEHKCNPPNSWTLKENSPWKAQRLFPNTISGKEKDQQMLNLLSQKENSISKEKKENILKDQKIKMNQTQIFLWWHLLCNHMNSKIYILRNRRVPKEHKRKWKKNSCYRKMSIKMKNHQTVNQKLILFNIVR